MQFQRLITLTAVFVLLPWLLPVVAMGDTKRPNIVLIMADDLGFETIGANGGTSYKTPVLDKLASEGVRFEHCYSQPICTPSRVKLMSGIYNVRNYAEFGFLETSQTTFAHLVRDAGYTTCIVGKWQLGMDATLPAHFGFDEHCLWQLLRRPSRYPTPGMEVNGEKQGFPLGYGPDVSTDYALDFIDRNRDKPFLLYYPMILTHCPFEPTPDSKDWDPQSKGSKTYKGDAKYFGDMVTYMDKQVGRILDQLDRVGVRENTLVLFTGDNGTDSPVVSMFRGRQVAGEKGKTTDGGTRVPLIAHWKGKTVKGQVCNDIVDFSDFLPTICEAAGANIRSSLGIDGRSFLPQLLGKTGNPREWIYVWYARNGGPKGREFTRNQRYKFYRGGEFYDIKQDVLEKNPLERNELSTDVQVVYDKLLRALNQYANARPSKFANWKENKRKKNAQKKNAQKKNAQKKNAQKKQAQKKQAQKKTDSPS
jgi:arylsulfatase A